MPKPIKIEIVGDDKSFQKAMGNVKKVLGVGAVAGLGAGFLAIADQSKAMEAAIVEGTGASGEALDSLLASTNEVLKEVPRSGEEVASAIADVNTFFAATDDELENLSESFLDFSKVTKVEVGTAIADTSGVMKQFRVDVSQTDEVLGDFVRISQATGAPMDALLGQVRQFGPLFTNAGFSLEETTAIFGQLKQAGVDVTRVGPGLNKFFRDVAENGEDPRASLEAVLDEMSRASTEAEALNLATEAFGAEGAQRMTTAVRSGALDLSNLNELMGEGAGLVDKQAAATEKFGEKWQRVKNNVFVRITPVATKLFDALFVGMDTVVPVVDTLADGLGTTVSVISSLTSAVTSNEPVMAALGAAVLTVGTIYAVNLIPHLVYSAALTVGTVVPAIIAKTTAWWGAATAMIAANAPVILITAGVAALAAGVVWAYENVEFFRTTVDGAASFLKDKAWPIFKKIGEAYGTLFKLQFGIARGAIDLVVGGVTWLAEKFTETKTTVTEGVEDVVSFFTEMPGRIDSAVDGMWDGISDGFKAVVNFVIDGWNRLDFSIPAFNIPFVGSFGGTDDLIPDIDRFARGTSFAPGGLAFVGEEGPELVNLPRGSQVFTNRESRRMMGGDVNVYVTTNANPRRIGEEAAWAVRMAGV